MNKIAISKLIFDVLTGSKLFTFFCWIRNDNLRVVQEAVANAIVASLRFLWIFRLFLFLQEILPSLFEYRALKGYLLATLIFYGLLLWNESSLFGRFVLAQVFLNGLMVFLRTGDVNISTAQQQQIEQFNEKIQGIYPKKKVSKCEKCNRPFLLRAFHCPICGLIKRGLRSRPKQPLFRAQHLH